jgi:5-deoxy-glucuronate isomerase
MTTNEWLFPRGSLSEGPWESVADARLPGWKHTGLRIAELRGRGVDLPAAGVERMVIPLAGSFAVAIEGERWRLAGRESVFAGPTDVIYLGRGTAARLEGDGRVAVDSPLIGEEGH